MSPNVQASAEWLYSVYGGDTDMSDLVALFVDEMDGRIECLQQLFCGENWDELGRFAHQLKGAAGSYGFGQLTPLALRLEQAVRNQAPKEQISEAVVALVDACRRTRSGVPS